MLKAINAVVVNQIFSPFLPINSLLIYQACTVCSLVVLSSSSDLAEPSELPDIERVRRVGTRNIEHITQAC